MKRIKNLLFVLTIMLIGFVGINNVKADTYPEYVEIGGTKLTAEKPYYQKQTIIKAVESCTLGEDGCMAYYDTAKGELTLKNYNAYSIVNEIANTDLTIKLIGDNVITEYTNDEFGIFNDSGNLTITSTDDASLKIRYETATRDKAIGIVNGYTNNSNGNITISGKTNITINVSVYNSSLEHAELSGITNLNGAVNINDDSNLIIRGDCSSNDHLYGIDAAETNINTTKNVSIDISNGLYSIKGSLNLIKFDTITFKSLDTVSIFGFAKIKDTDITKYLFDLPDSNTLIITNDSKLSGIMIHTSKQYEYYKSSPYGPIILGEDIDHTSTTGSSSKCDDNDDYYHDAIYCNSFWKISSDKVLDLNGHTLTVQLLNLQFNGNATLTIMDSSEEKTGTLAIPNNNYGTFNISDSSKISSGKNYGLVFDGGNYDYGQSFCIYTYCTTTFINANELKKGNLNIQYKNNPIFVNHNSRSKLFKTSDSNVRMNPESMTYMFSGDKGYAGLFSSSDAYYYSKTYGDLINKYTTEATINGKKIPYTQRFDFVLDDAVNGDNVIVIAPKVAPYDIEIADVEGIVNKIYNGNEQTQNLIVKYNGEVLEEGTDYRAFYSSNINVGTATITIIGKGNYTGELVKTFEIKQFTSNAPSSLKLKLTSYNSVKVSWTKVDGVDGYFVYYKAAGYNYALLGTTSNLSMTKTKMLAGKQYYFKVIPYILVNDEKVKSNSYIATSIYALKKMAAPTVVKYNNSQVKVKWSIVNGNSGYQVARSVYKSKNFKILKTVNNSYLSYRFKTTKNKTYYYKVRTYKWVDGQKIYGPWSNVKAFKLK